MGNQSDASNGLLIIPLYDMYFLGDVEITSVCFCFSSLVVL